MKVLGIAGWSGAGKTTLIERLLPLLLADGMTVSTIKATHHGVDLDQSGKDSFRHRAAGATEVMLVSDDRWALLRETAERPPIESLIARLSPVDLVFVEGFRNDAMPKLEVYRPALDRPPLWPDRPDILAVATDDPALIADAKRPVLPLDNPSAIVTWLIHTLDIRPGSGSRGAMAA